MLFWALDTKGAKILPCGSTGSARTAVPGGFCPGRRSAVRPSVLGLPQMEIRNSNFAHLKPL